MTREEAMDAMLSADAHDRAGVPYGFFICVLSRDDLASRLSPDTMAKLDAGSLQATLSGLADALHDEFENTAFHDCLCRVLSEEGLE